MRFSILVALLASAVTVSAFAQEQESRTKYTYTPAQQSENRLIPVVGLTMNQLTGSGIEAKNDTGFNVGITRDIGANDTVFHTGILLSQLNTKGNDDDGDSVTLSNLYLSAPVQGKTYLQGGQSGVYARYGALVNILLSSKIKTANGSGNAKDAFNTLDLMGSVGLGVMIPGQSMDFMVDVSFNRSLISVISVGNVNIYNQALMLNAGVAL